MNKKDKKVDNSSENKYEDITIDEDQEMFSGMKGRSEKKLRKELKQVQKEAKEYLDGWQRAKADLINYKRESEEARTSFAKFATEDLLHQLLPVLDSFDAALAHGEDGVQHIYKQLLAVLKASGVEQVDPLGDQFDPAQHESVGTKQVENKKEDDAIVEVVQKGYTLHTKLIRPAKVRVGEFKH